MRWTILDRRELNRTAMSIVIAFLGGFTLEKSTELTGSDKILFLAGGIFLFMLGIFLGFTTTKKLRDELTKLENRLTNLEGFFGIKPKESDEPHNAINFDKSKNSGKVSLRDNISLGANIATLVAVGMTFVTLLILIQTTSDNKVVIDALEGQLDESKKNADLLTTIMTNSYVDYKPNLVLQIYPINGSFFGGNNPHQFIVEVYNYGQKESLVNMTWSFGVEGGCFHGQPITSLHVFSNTNQVIVKKSDSNLAQTDVPNSFENVRNLTSFSVKLDVLEYPYDPSLGKIKQYMKYNWAFITFDYNGTYKMWMPRSLADTSTLCEIPTLQNSRLVLNTSDNTMFSYDVSR